MCIIELLRRKYPTRYQNKKKGKKKKKPFVAASLIRVKRFCTQIGSMRGLAIRRKAQMKGPSQPLPLLLYHCNEGTFLPFQRTMYLSLVSSQV